MTKDQLRMQMLAGIITEGQYKAKLNEGIYLLFNKSDGKLKTTMATPGENDSLKKQIEDKGEYEVVWSTDSKFINPQNVIGKTRKELGL